MTEDDLRVFIAARVDSRYDVAQVTEEIMVQVWEFVRDRLSLYGERDAF